MKIAFFDSGIGGLTVLKEAVQQFPVAEFIYYADTQNVPYGTKSKSEVIGFVNDAIEFLAKQNIDALVVACNTATSVAIADIRKKYRFPIVGMEPAVKPAVLDNQGKYILVLATTLTLNESKLNTLIASVDKNDNVRKMEMDRLVEFAEDFDFSSDTVKEYMRHKLEKINLTEFETVVLGCTHFIYYKNILREIIGGEIKIIDGNSGTINQLKRMVQFADCISSGKQNIRFFSSGIEDTEERVNKLMALIQGKDTH